MSMETKVIKPLLRSLFISYALSALFLGALAFALYKLRLGESLVNLLIFAVYFAACFAGGFFTGRKVRNRRFFWGLLSGMFYFLILFAASWAMDPRASIQAARSLMVLGVPLAEPLGECSVFKVYILQQFPDQKYQAA